eukprot:275605-Pelagomonas_calceolata.AAC.1
MAIMEHTTRLDARAAMMDACTLKMTIVVYAPQGVMCLQPWVNHGTVCTTRRNVPAATVGARPTWPSLCVPQGLLLLQSWHSMYHKTSRACSHDGCTSNLAVIVQISRLAAPALPVQGMTCLQP